MKIIITEEQYKKIIQEGMYIGDDGTLMDDIDNTPVDKSFDIPNGTENMIKYRIPSLRLSVRIKLIP